MNIGEFGKIVGVQADALGNKIQKKSQKKMGEGLGTLIASGTIEKDKIKNVNVGKIGRTLGGGIGGAVEGSIAGTAGGAVVGGIAGGIDDDETFLGGVAKGALIGGTLGGLGGAASGALHGNGQLVINGINDINTATSKLSGLGHDGIDLAGKLRDQIHEAKMTSIYNPKVQEVL